MSWQLQLLNAQLRLITRPRIGRTRAPEDADHSVTLASELAWMPPYLRVQRRQGNLYWISAGPHAVRRVLLYFHGGGYIAGSPLTHRAMLGRLSRMAGIEVCAPRYPLAQRAPFPAQFDAGLAAWAQLMAMGYAPQHVCLGGDSAGGGLALALLSHLCAQGTPPAGLMAFSPWTDLALTGDSLATNGRSDPLLPPERIGELAQIVLNGADPADPRISPLYARFPNCPPVWLAWAETEILRDDSTRMVQLLRRGGTLVETEVHPRAPHVWPLFQGWLPEGTATLRRAAWFVQASLTETSL